MELRTERVELGVILHLNGRLTAEAGAGWLRDAGRAVMGHCVRRVLLDMGKVSRIDSSGIGPLVQSRQHTHEARRTLALVDVDRRQKCTLELSGLLSPLSSSARRLRNSSRPRLRKEVMLLARHRRAPAGR